MVICHTESLPEQDTAAADHPEPSETNNQDKEDPPDLMGNSKLWLGKDYSNFIRKDWVQLDRPFEGISSILEQNNIVVMLSAGLRYHRPVFLHTLLQWPYTYLHFYTNKQIQFIYCYVSWVFMRMSLAVTTLKNIFHCCLYTIYSIYCSCHLCSLTVALKVSAHQGQSLFSFFPPCKITLTALRFLACRGVIYLLPYMAKLPGT